MERANHAVQGQERPHPDARPAKKGMQPPLTPMIDVVFQLLLFFLLSCQFRQAEAAIPANLPEIGGGPAPEPIRIAVLPAGPDRRGAIYRVGHDGQVLEGPAELYARLAQIRRSIPGEGLGVVICPSRQVRWRHVVEAMNQSVRADYKKVAFATAHDGAEQGNGI